MTHRRSTARGLRRAALCGLLLTPLSAAPALGETVAATGTGQATVRVTRPLIQLKIARAVDRARDPNRYCGRVTTVKRRVVDGTRRVVSRRTRVRCFAPQAAVISLYVEFAATPLAPPAA